MAQKISDYCIVDWRRFIDTPTIFVSGCKNNLNNPLGFFEYMAANPAAGIRFDESMSAVSNYVLEAGRAADLFDW